MVPTRTTNLFKRHKKFIYKEFRKLSKSLQKSNISLIKSKSFQLSIHMYICRFLQKKLHEKSKKN